MMHLADLSPILALACRAGDAIMEIYGTESAGSPVQWKDDDSPLTAADLAAHEILVEGLRALTPEIPVISEEGEERLAGSNPSALRWLVDPLDGTKEFLKRSGEFTVNVALVRDAVPVAGVVHAPALHRSWLGAQDGAAGVSRDGSFPIRSRKAAWPRLGLVVSRDHAGPAVKGLERLFPDAEVRSVGSSLKFCLIAEGQSDLYLRDGPTMEWDTAAAQAVLEAAGGGVFDLDGDPLRYGKQATRNPSFLAVGDTSIDWADRLSDLEGI